MEETMSIISSSDLQTILDKAARHAAEVLGDPNVVTTPNAGLLVANTDVLAALQTAVAGFTDDGQVADLLPAVYGLAQAPPGLSFGPIWAGVLDALDRHCRRFGYDTLDKYLDYLNVTTPTLRAHGDFAAYIRGLSPGNVFTPANWVVMHVTVTGAGTATFTHIAALDTTKYGKAQIKVLNTKTEGLTSTVLTFPKAQKNGADHSVVATITDTTDGHLTVFDDTDLAFTDVLVTSATISGGNSTDTFDIVIVPDRDIAAA
jgi:hypothetical protein